MSVATCTSLQVMIASFDGYAFVSKNSCDKTNIKSRSVGGRVRTPVQLANNIMLKRQLEEHHRHEMIACGHTTTPVGSSAEGDFEILMRKVEAMVRALGEFQAK